jgi:hypothetical protein
MFAYDEDVFNGIQKWTGACEKGFFTNLYNEKEHCTASLTYSFHWMPKAGWRNLATVRDAALKSCGSSY